MSDTIMNIALIDANDMLAEAQLDDDSFYVGVSWNEFGDFWTLSLRSADNTVLTSGIKIVPTRALLHTRRKTGFPKGEIMVYCPTLQRLTRQSFASGLARLLYIPQELLLSEGLIDYEDP